MGAQITRDKKIHFLFDKWRNRNINYFTTGQKIISVYFLLSRSLRTMFEGLNLEILIL